MADIADEVMELHDEDRATRLSMASPTDLHDTLTAFVSRGRQSENRARLDVISEIMLRGLKP